MEEHQASVGHSLAAVKSGWGGSKRDLTATRELAKSFRNEMDSFSRQSHADFATVESEIRRIDQVTDLRERLASVEAKLSAHHG
jgi:hypothetical protein